MRFCFLKFGCYWLKCIVPRYRGPHFIPIMIKFWGVKKKNCDFPIGIHTVKLVCVVTKKLSRREPSIFSFWAYLSWLGTVHTLVGPNAKKIIAKKIFRGPGPLQFMSWSRHAIAKTTVFVIEILYALLNVGCHQNFLMLNFYTTYYYEFLSNFLCSWHVFSSTFINRSINILLEFWRFYLSSEARVTPTLLQAQEGWAVSTQMQMHHFPPCLHGSFPQRDMITA